MNQKLKILILMAGTSESFKEAGYYFPKNLVEINGQSVIQMVIENLNSLKTSYNCEFIFLVNKNECRQFHIDSVIKLLEPQAHVIEVPELTSGAACTALLAITHINNDENLLIINGDDIMEYDFSRILSDFQNRKLDAGTVVFNSVHPRWSFVKINKEAFVVEAAEKNPISRLATAGFYYFKSGSDAVEAIMAMIKKDASVQGQFYICPLFNEMILKQKKIGIYEISKKQYFPLKNPQSIEEYITAHKQ